MDFLIYIHFVILHNKMFQPMYKIPAIPQASSKGYFVVIIQYTKIADLGYRGAFESNL